MPLFRSLREAVLRFFRGGDQDLMARVQMVQTVIGAFSITKTVLNLHGGIQFDPDDEDDDFDSFLPMMENLCGAMGIPPIGLNDYKSLLDLRRRAVITRGEITPADVEYAEALRNRYVNWVYDFFPGYQRTLEPGCAVLHLGGVAESERAQNDDDEPSLELPQSPRRDPSSPAMKPNPGARASMEDIDPDASHPKTSRPSGTIIANALGMWLICGGLMVLSPRFERPFQVIAVGVAVYTLIVGGLLFFQYRWSPELLLTFFILAAGWTTYFMVGKGFTALGIATLAYELYGIAMYRSMCREARR
jgi:hypothetical protein